jgi:hypothetical protein
LLPDHLLLENDAAVPALFAGFDVEVVTAQYIVPPSLVPAPFQLILEQPLASVDSLMRQYSSGQLSPAQYS